MQFVEMLNAMLKSDSAFSAARILRAIRIAARLGFCISKETAHAVKSLSYSILRLDKVFQELFDFHFTYYCRVLSYFLITSCFREGFVRLLWKFGLLELLLPIQAAYFVRHGFCRRDKRTNILLVIVVSLFSNLDKLLSPDKPCHSSLWVAILAFHSALSEQPRDPLVVAALSLAIHNGGDMLEAASIDKRVTKVHDVGFHELLESQNLNPRALRDEVKNLAASLMLSQAMAGYPQAPYLDLVCWIFSCITFGAERGFIPKQGSKIDYESLAHGAQPEVRHIFARVVLIPYILLA
ncbi:hypothetical protein D8674_040848 [Pyrus ussuriensis x Pyrus communis]|uniref:Uncharacterized protein n=1 Tax=Pyrus ussuriensis x Pyrus communis TaxID=2448454 RepID=A0A5N5HCG6_9ROSA|nr:hypothetical protein D8674_040848 [Pyrus ussuriensis x Pyrus communis]